MRTISIHRLTVPGHATRRDFAVYVVVARERGTKNFFMYVGKTGDNREGCNPIISRAGNHFSFNKVHSQVRNKLADRSNNDPQLFDYEYFYIAVGSYNAQDAARKQSIDLVNEMERALNIAAQRRLPGICSSCLLNPYKGGGALPIEQRSARQALLTTDRRESIEALVDAVWSYVASFNPAFASNDGLQENANLSAHEAATER